MKTDGLDDAFNVETSIVPAEVEKVQKKEKTNADHIGKIMSILVVIFIVL